MRNKRGGATKKGVVVIDFGEPRSVSWGFMEGSTQAERENGVGIDTKEKTMAKASIASAPSGRCQQVQATCDIRRQLFAPRIAA